MENVQKGDTVAIHYTARLADGTVFDKTAKEDPLTFTQGEGHVLPALEQAVLGMVRGETKTVHLSENDLYGPPNPGLVVELERTEFIKRGINPEIGLALETNNERNGKNEPRIFRVTNVSETTVTLDGNHPLAGRSLTFDLYLYSLGK